MNDLSQKLIQAETLMDAFPALVCIKDREGRWLEANQRTLRFFGLDKESYKGKKGEEIARMSPLYGQIWEECEFYDHEMLISGTTFQSEQEVSLPDGTRIIWEVIKVPVIDKQKVIQGILIFARDITLRKQVMQKLEESEQRYKSLVLHNPDMVFTLDMDGTFLSQNPSVEKITGYCGEDLFKKPFESFLDPKDIPRVIRQFNSTKQGVPQYGEVAMYHKQGSMLYLYISFVPIFVHQQVVGIYCIAKDKTLQKRTEKELRESKEQYRLLVESLPETVAVHSDGKVTYINETGAKLLGAKSPQEILGKSILDFFTVERKSYISEKLAGKYARDSMDTTIQKMVRLDGEQIYVEAKSMPVSYLGKPASQLIMRDITVQKETEQKLEENEQRYQSLLRHNPDGIYLLDLQGNVLEANPATEHITSYRIEEILQQSFYKMIVPEDLDKTLYHFNKAAGGESQKFEVAIQHRMGHIVQLSVKNVPVVIRESITGIYFIIKDITEKKRTEELLRKSDKLSVVGQLAAGVAHEIRNPLTSLKGFVQLLQSGAVNKREYLEIMLSELNRIELIISELLVLAKPNIVTYQSKDIVELLVHVIRLLETQAILKNIEIITEFEENLPFIHCEENQLKQVFINILKNAMEAMPHGGKININVKMINKKTISVSFTDRGCGLSPEQLSKIGEPFYTTKEKGTGLGLMVSYKIIENHKGYINIKSEVQKGTTVEIILPLP